MSTIRRPCLLSDILYYLINSRFLPLSSLYFFPSLYSLLLLSLFPTATYLSLPPSSLLSFLHSLFLFLPLYYVEKVTTKGKEEGEEEDRSGLVEAREYLIRYYTCARPECCYRTERVARGSKEA
ncbi:MAG: hypothetical protein QXM88_00015 [Candidatus Nitrosocaldus sp.]